MSEEQNNPSNQNYPQLNTNSVNSERDSYSNEENTSNQNLKEKKMRKKKEEKEKEDDYLLLAYPEMGKSFKAKVQNCIIEILKKVDIINEKDIVVKLIFECEAAKEYYKLTHETQYLRRILWKMAKDKIILRAKIVGDERYTWYLLPEKVEKLRDKILRRS